MVSHAAPQRPLLHYVQLRDPSGGEFEHAVELAAGKSGGLSCSLDIGKTPHLIRTEPEENLVKRRMISMLRSSSARRPALRVHRLAIDLVLCSA